MSKNIKKFFTNEKVCVLTLTTSIPDELGANESDFYNRLFASFNAAVSERFFPLAVRAYTECTDRRKKWRYSPLQASFTLTPKDSGTLMLTLSTAGTLHIKEEHTWREGFLVRRKKLGI